MTKEEASKMNLRLFSYKDGNENKNANSNNNSLEVEDLSNASKNKKRSKNSNNRKLQVSRSHLFEFNHFTRMLNILYENSNLRKITRSFLIENSGLPDGQIASLISIGNSLELINIGTQTLTPTGMLIAKHDIFLEDIGTLEWCHYKGAGSYRNLIWYDIFNSLLKDNPGMNQEGWEEYFRKRLSGNYTDKTIHYHVPKETRFIIDAYINGNFKKLEILRVSSDKRFYANRHIKVKPLIFCSMIYDFCQKNGIRLYQIIDILEASGSPAVVFGIDINSFRQQIEILHNKGWIRYETTHDLDQIRLKADLSAIEFLKAYYEKRDL